MRIQTVIQTCAIGLALAGLPPSAAHAENFGRGQELFDHQCKGCHDDLRLAAKEGKAKTLKDLRNKIASWAEHSGAEWGKSEVDDVLFYMDKSFYHFKDAAD